MNRYAVGTAVKVKFEGVFIIGTITANAGDIYTINTNKKILIRWNKNIFIATEMDKVLYG